MQQEGRGRGGILHIYLCKQNYLLHRSCLVIAGNIKCRKRRIDRIKLVPLSAVVQRAQVRDQNIRAKVCSKTDRSRQVPTMVLCLRKVVFWMVVTNEKWSLSRSRCTWRCMKGLVSKETVVLRRWWSEIHAMICFYKIS